MLILPALLLALSPADGVRAHTKVATQLQTSIRAIHSSPKTSVASYLIEPRSVRTAVLLTWPRDVSIAGWLVEVSVLHEAAGKDWHAWEPAATLPASETSHLINLEPGLSYAFRIAGLSDAEGQMPFGEATPPVSVLGDPSGALQYDAISGCYLPHEAEAMSANAAAGAEEEEAEEDEQEHEAMPWDAAGLAAVRPSRAPPPAPTAADALRTDVWAAGETPLLSLVPTSADLALLQAQSSLLAAVRAGEKRLRVELLCPGLNRVIESSHAYSEPLLGFTALALAESLRGLKVQCVFPSAGTGAGARSAFEKAASHPLSSHVSVGAFSGAVTRDAIASDHDFTAKCVDPEAPADVYLVVAPTNSRGDAVALAVRQAVDKVPGACWVIFNPDLEDTILSYTFGITTSDAVRSFVGAFKPCFYYRGIFQTLRPSNRVLERGCLLHHFKGPWVAHGLCAAAGGFDELASFEERPSRAELSALPW